MSLTSPGEGNDCSLLWNNFTFFNLIILRQPLEKAVGPNEANHFGRKAADDAEPANLKVIPDYFQNMKKSLILIALVMIVGLGALFLIPDASVRVLLLSSSAPGVAERDLRMTEAVTRYLALRGQERDIHFDIVEVDVAQPPDALATALDEVMAAGEPALTIGCGDSACVRQVIPELDRLGLLLMYPGSSEGLIRSRRVMHLGLVANQFLFPAVSWIRQNLGEDILYLGSESARSRMMERLISRQLLSSSGGELVSSEYLTNIELLPSVVDRINVYRPDVVLFDACEWLPRPELKAALEGLKTKVFSLCTDDHLSGRDIYYVSHYFDHEHNQENLQLQAELQVPLNALIVQATTAVDLYLRARRAGYTRSNHELSTYISGRNALTAAGSMAVDFGFQGVWHSVFIVRTLGEREHLLWMSDSLIRPVMFPGLEAPSDWQHHLTIYWRNNGGRWRQGSVGGKRWL
jgi:urea transport system substrate-binding protein